MRRSVIRFGSPKCVACGLPSSLVKTTMVDLLFASFRPRNLHSGEIHCESEDTHLGLART